MVFNEKPASTKKHTDAFYAMFWIVQIVHCGVYYGTAFKSPRTVVYTMARHLVRRIRGCSTRGTCRWRSVTT